MPYQPRATLDNPYGPQVTFRTEDVLPPSAYYVGVDDQLVLDISADYAPVTYFLVVRMLSPEGVINYETLQLTNTASGVQKLSQTMTGMEGYLLSACLSAPGAPIGSSYAAVTLKRSPYLASGLTTALLLAGYISDKQFLSYPTTTPRGPAEGPANIKYVILTPGVGAQWSVASPSGARWRIRGVVCTLLTDVTVAARGMIFYTASAAGDSISYFVPGVTQPASTEYFYSLNPGGQAEFMTPAVSVPGSTEILIENGGVIGANCQSFQPGDQYLKVIVQVEEWVGT